MLSFNTGKDEQPWALLGYDLISKENIFIKHFAPMLHHSQAFNLDDSPGVEIVVALAGTSDGLFFGEFFKDSSYLAILNNNSSVRKKWAYLGESSSELNGVVFNFLKKEKVTLGNSQLIL